MKASSNLGASLVRDFQEGWESCDASAWGAASAGKLGKVLVACVLGRGTWKGKREEQGIYPVHGAEAQRVINGGLEAHSEQSVLEGEAAKVHRWMKEPERRGYKWGLGCS